MEQTVQINGMKCDGCVKIVKEKFEAISGVQEVNVSLEDKKAVITGVEPVSDEQLTQALADTKFTVA